MLLAAPGTPQRLDRFLASAVEGLSRARAQALIAEGRVRVNGRRGAKGSVVGPADQVEVEGEVAPPDWTPRPDPDVAVRVALEDDDVLVLDKPSGVPTHPLRPEEMGTVANWLAAHRPQTTGVGYGPREPGIVHRLDVGTSGLLLVAKNAAAFERLQADLRAGKIEKEYLAIVEGPAPQADVIGFAIDDEKSGKVVAWTDELPKPGRRARPAETVVDVVRRLGPRALVRASVAKAARHQVRVHLAAIGCPLLGDALYGGPEVPGLSRHALHAAGIRFAHPKDGHTVRVTSPLPPELQAIVDAGAPQP